MAAQLRGAGCRRRHCGSSTRNDPAGTCRMPRSNSEGSRLARNAKGRQYADKRGAHVGVEGPEEQLDERAHPQARTSQAQNRRAARLDGGIGHKARHKQPKSQATNQPTHHGEHQTRRAQLDASGTHQATQGACKIQHIKAKGSAKNGADATRHARRSPLASAGVARRDVISAGNARSRTSADKGNRKGCKRRARKGGNPARIPTRVVQDGNRQRVDRAGRHTVGKVKPEDNKGRLQADPKNRARWQRLSPSPSLCLVFFRHGVSPVDV